MDNKETAVQSVNYIVMHFRNLNLQHGKIDMLHFSTSASCIIIGFKFKKKPKNNANFVTVLSSGGRDKV